MDLKSVGFEFGEIEEKESGDSRLGVFKGYGAAYGNVDRDNDIVEPGTFAKSLDPSGVSLLWQHDRSQPIGVYRALKETKSGLEVEGELNLDVQRGREAYALLKQGAIKSLSIGYAVNRGGSSFETFQDPETKEKKRVRRIKSAKLYEISLVTIPANTAAAIHGVKMVKDENGDLPGLHEFEDWLRKAGGLSRSEAKCIIAQGYKQLYAERSGHDDEDAVREAGSGEIINSTLSSQQKTSNGLGKSKLIRASLAELKSLIGDAI